MRPPTRPLRPVIPNNACTLRITAAAGTELAGASFGGTVNPLARGSSHLTGLYDPKAFITHAALLRQAFAHCAIFPTAASRRSLVRVSVPVWLIILSDQLPIVALVGLYPANQLIGRGPLSVRPRRTFDPIPAGTWSHAVLATVSGGYPPPRGRLPTCYSPVCRSTRRPEGPLSRSTCMC